MNNSLHVYDTSVLDFINKDFEIENRDDYCLFTEGPVWNNKGFYLFSDIPSNRIYKMAEGEGKDVFLHESGTNNPSDPDINHEQPGSNGLAYDTDNNLLICQHGSHAVAKWDGKKINSFIGTYRGKPFNSPNDLVVHKDGRIYFSDPPYGLKDGKLNPGKFQAFAGVYCWSDGDIKLICDQYQYPNGVCLSPDGTVLYISSNKPFEKFIFAYDTATNRFIKIFAEENSDGMKFDKHGNVYLSNKEGIIILNKEGKRMALIQLPTVPANICWGGKELNDLFITAGKNIFLIKSLQK